MGYHSSYRNMGDFLPVCHWHRGFLLPGDRRSHELRHTSSRQENTKAMITEMKWESGFGLPCRSLDVWPFKGTISRILTDFWTNKIYISVGENFKKINGPYLLTIAILEHRNSGGLKARLAADGSDGNGLQFENVSQRFEAVSASLQKIDIYSLSLNSNPNKGSKIMISCVKLPATYFRTV